MTHLYQNDDGEVVAADSAEQAGHWHDVEMGGEPAVVGSWDQIPDHVVLAIEYDDGSHAKTAGEWAAECGTPDLVATTYN